MHMLINLMVGILSQRMCTSNHHTVCFKYTTISFVNYTSIKLVKWVFREAIFIVARNWTQSRCFSTELVSELRHSYKIECYSAIKR